MPPDTPRPQRDDATSAGELVDRGPAETLAPSRTALVSVGLVAVVIAVLAGLGVVNLSGRQLGEGEELLEEGRHALTAGPVTLEADLPGDWIARQRCDRWVQLNDAADDATTLHVVWLDAVPEPSTADPVTMVETPDDLVGWWREDLDLEVTELPDDELDGRVAHRHALDATQDARRRDGLVACGDIGEPAGVGMFGPAGRFDQQVAVVDVDGTPLMLVAAAFVGGDAERVGQALEEVLATGTLSGEPA